MSTGKHSRIGIVLWTANKYISEHPRCGLGAVMRHTSTTLGLRNVSYMSMSAGRCKFWTRTRGRLPGEKRVQWLYSVSPLGQELAEAPKPPSLEEVARRSAQRKRPFSHRADWATDAQPGELLVPRGVGGHFGVYATRVGEEHSKMGPDGHLVHNDRYSVYVGRDAVLIFQGLGVGFQVAPLHMHGIVRPCNWGSVNVISPSGETLAIQVDALKPLQRRKYVRPALTNNVS